MRGEEVERDIRESLNLGETVPAGAAAATIQVRTAVATNAGDNIIFTISGKVGGSDYLE
jgi:hypothetical protein